MASKFLTVAKPLLQSNQSLTAAASTFGWRHSFSSQSIRGRVRQTTLMGWMKHPFLTQGLEAMCTIYEYEGESTVKIDMPGVGKEGLEIKVKKNEIHIEGKAEKEIEDALKEEDVPERIYAGVFDLPPGIYDADEMKASIKLGVVKLVIPKLNPSHLLPPKIELRGNPTVRSMEVDREIGIQGSIETLSRRNKREKKGPN